MAAGQRACKQGGVQKNTGHNSGVRDTSLGMSAEGAVSGVQLLPRNSKVSLGVVIP